MPETDDLASEKRSRFVHRFEVACTILMLVAFGARYLELFKSWSSSPEGRLFLVSPSLLFFGDTLVLALTLFQRPSQRLNTSIIAVFSALAASSFFAFVSFERGSRLDPFLSWFLQLLGVTLQIAAKFWLGRSFGLLPAHRGIVRTGPYRFVRHPIYLGYFLNHIGFLLFAFSLWNLGLFLGLYTLQLVRISFEEKVLSQDPAYVEYKQHVRWRFIPFVY